MKLKLTEFITEVEEAIGSRDNKKLCELYETQSIEFPVETKEPFSLQVSRLLVATKNIETFLHLTK